MGRAVVDLTKESFGRLQPLRPLGRRKKGAVVWRCQCRCGALTDVRADKLRDGTTKSCGCLRKQLARLTTLYHKYESIDEWNGYKLNLRRQIDSLLKEISDCIPIEEILLRRERRGQKKKEQLASKLTHKDSTFNRLRF